MGIPQTSDGKQYVCLWPTEGSRTNVISHNWCDRTTWYSFAPRVVGETLQCQNSGTWTQYSMSHQYIIDTYHGKLSDEDYLLDTSGNSYRIDVRVNGTSSVERDPHYGSGGDFVCDYDSGIVTFMSALSSSDVVTATYHHASSSLMVLKPTPGKQIKIRSAEVQFGVDVSLQDTVTFDIYGLVDVFAPQLCPTPYPTGTLIPLGYSKKYKTRMDYINEANGARPVIPHVITSGSWREHAHDITIYQWEYQAVVPLVSSAGMEVRVKLQHDTPFSGSIATVTFYCLSEDE